MFKALNDRFSTWQTNRRRRRVEKLTARAASLEDGKPYDLLFPETLVRRGRVTRVTCLGNLTR